MLKKLLIGSLGLLFTLSGISFVVRNAQANSKSDTTKDKYIVVLKDEVVDPDEIANEISRSHGVGIEHRYQHTIKGFSATIPEAKLAKVKADPRIQFVSEDREVSITAKTPVSIQAQTIPTGVNRIGVSATNSGEGIGVAIIDTGINLSHPDLAANLGPAKKSCVFGKSPNDDNGHGSHVAGTVAAINNTTGVIGTASKAKLFPVKVLNAAGSGTWSQVICGIDWVTANAVTYNIKIANMSLGGGGSNDNNCGNSNNDALHKAICKSRDKGVTYVVAAGNSGTNASTFVPAAYDDAVVTVSALADSDGQAGGTGTATSYGADDTFASFSNYGSVVDLGAPGVSIYSTYKNGGYATLSGTSMASPHVAGAAALYLKVNPGSTWTQVRDGLKSIGEVLNSGHTDPSGKHPEPVVKVNTL